MPDPNYPIPPKPVYDPDIRQLQNTDKAKADEIFNPVFQKIINNIHAVKQHSDTAQETAETAQKTAETAGAAGADAGSLAQKALDELAMENGAVNQLATTIGYLSKVAENIKTIVMQVALANTEAELLWFNNSAKAVAFPTGKSRNNLDYEIHWEPVSVSGGSIGDVIITGKQLNGFTIAYTGGAKSVTLNLYIQGGLWQC